MEEEINYAANFIKQGGIVVFPTETVYGIGADATNIIASSQIFRIKNRPTINPLIVHIADLKQAMELGEFSDKALMLADHFWPGPLTIVVPYKGRNIAHNVLAGRSTIALRMPNHKIARELIIKSERVIAAPSANPSGYISGTRYIHVSDHFKHNKEIFILSSFKEEECIFGIESTIIYSVGDEISILRHGFITQNAIEIFLKCNINIVKDKIIAPGMLEKHYSPQTKLVLNITKPENYRIIIAIGKINFQCEYILNLSKTGDLIEAANKLYHMLYIADLYAIKNDIKEIAIMPIDNCNIGIAINDRLIRAAK